jgi:hypothetical protein
MVPGARLRDPTRYTLSRLALNTKYGIREEP